MPCNQFAHPYRTFNLPRHLFTHLLGSFFNPVLQSTILKQKKITVKSPFLLSTFCIFFCHYSDYPSPILFFPPFSPSLLLLFAQSKKERGLRRINCLPAQALIEDLDSTDKEFVRIHRQECFGQEQGSQSNLRCHRHSNRQPCIRIIHVGYHNQE